MLLRPWDTRLCAFKLTLHHAVGERHDIALARRRKLDDRPSDRLSAFVIVRRKPKNKGGGGKYLIHNFDIFGLESCLPRDTGSLHEVVPCVARAHVGSMQPPCNRISRTVRHRTTRAYFGLSESAGFPKA